MNLIHRIEEYRGGVALTLHGPCSLTKEFIQNLTVYVLNHKEYNKIFATHFSNDAALVLYDHIGLFNVFVIKDLIEKSAVSLWLYSPKTSSYIVNNFIEELDLDWVY